MQTQVTTNKLNAVKESIDGVRSQFAENFQRQNQLIRERFEKQEQRLQQIDIEIRVQTRKRVEAIRLMQDDLETQINKTLTDITAMVDKIVKENEEIVENFGKRFETMKVRMKQEEDALQAEADNFIKETAQGI